MSAAGEMGEGPGIHGSSEPSEDELRAAYEEELSRITATDMMAQAAVSLLNIGARRLAPASPDDPGGRDLEQARDAIDGARALLEILERRIPRELAPLRDALSRLQMTYAREAGAAATTGADATAGDGPASGGPRPGARPPAPGAGEPDAGGQPTGDPVDPTRSARPDEEATRGPGPAESSGRLWVPGR